MALTEASPHEDRSADLSAEHGATQRGKILSDTLWLNAASVIGQVFGVLQSLVVMHLLGPEGMGVWLGAAVILGYAAYAHLGIDYGMGIRLPYYRGRNDPERAEAIQDTGYLAWTVLALIAATALLLIAFTVSVSEQSRNAMIAVAVIIPFEQQTSFFVRWQASARLDFRLASYLAVARSVLSFLLVVPLTAAFRLPGFLAGMAAVAVVMFAVWCTRVTFRPGGRVSAEAFAEMVRIGFPILVVSLAGILIQTVDRLLILGMLGTASLGYYGVTTLGGGMLYGVLAQAGNAVSPHLSAEFGRTREDPASLERFLVKPTLLIAIAAAAGIMLLAAVIPALVHLALPRFLPGLPAFYAYVPGFYFLGLILTANNILNIILIEQRRQRIVVYIQALAIALQAGLGWLLLRAEIGLPGVALASTASYAFYGVTILVMAAQQAIPEPARRLTFLWRALFPLGACLAVGALMLWSGSLVSGSGTMAIVLRLLLQASIGVLLLTPILIVFTRRAGLGGELHLLTNLAPLQALRRLFGTSVSR